MTQPTRFAFYGRVSTVEKQDPTLSFPSQERACQAKARELGGEIVCGFTDQASGTTADRPGWSTLIAEARQTERRFDGVICFSTSRLARDLVMAGLFERELRHAGVGIYYVQGAADTSTAEGGLLVTLQQAFDQYEVEKIRRETRRGMTEGTRQGYRMGGRAPYGYRTVREPTPEGHRGEAKDRVTLTTEPTEAETVALIFHLHGDHGWSPKAIAERLNQPGGPSPPRHVDSRRNGGRHWAQSTIASMLRNPVYTGSMVWNRLDFSTRRQNGGAPRLRAEEEWIVTPDSHPRLVSDPAFKRSQERFRDRPRQQHTNGGTSNGHGRQYALAGMVYCCAGHKPMSMQGKTRKKGERTYRYMACAYRDQYGDTAAAEIHGGAKWIYMNEDVLMPLVEEFFRTRIWGPMRLKKLAAQLKSHGRERVKRGELKATKLRQMVATADRNIKQQVLAIEEGIPPAVVKERIAELEEQKEAAQEALAELGPEDIEIEDDYLAERLARLPDLGKQLRDAPVEVKRQIFEAFELRIELDKPNRRLEISATVTEAVAEAFEDPNALQTEGFRVTGPTIAGGRYGPISDHPTAIEIAVNPRL